MMKIILPLLAPAFVVTGVLFVSWFITTMDASSWEQQFFLIADSVAVAIIGLLLQRILRKFHR